MRATGRAEDSVARSGNYISGLDKRADEIKTALGGIRRDLDSAKSKTMLTFFADDTDNTAAAVRFMLPWFEVGSASVSESSAILLPFDCTIRRLFMRWSPGTGGGSLTVTVRRNGSDTSLYTTIPVVAEGGNNTTSSAVFEAGDLISLKLVTNATVTASPTALYGALELRC